MGIVFKPEPPPPDAASHEVKMAWYRRERARAVATLQRQGGTLDFGLAAIVSVAIVTGVALLERRLARGSRPWFRRWLVVVMDNSAPTRVFWSHVGAARYRGRHSRCAYLYRWQRDGWAIWEGAF